MGYIRNIFLREIKFFSVIGLFFLSILVFHDNTAVAMWIGFVLAGYSAIANDSIQTLGTFFASNKNISWKWIWLFVGGILAITFAYGWYVNSGDVSFGRLTKVPLPQEFNIVHLAAPLVLLILTRFKIPVSTTFLILSVFSSSKTIVAMLQKTFIGYFVAFIVALALWAIIGHLMRKKLIFKSEYNVRAWRVFQWFATGYLWFTWLQQDIANIAVFLPRTVSFEQLAAMIALLVGGMGLLTYLRGGTIQSVVTEKKDVTDIRAASIIDLVLGTILLIFKELNDLPMSTTWVFLGLLAGREIALSYITEKTKKYDATLKLVMKDVALASIGIVVSIALALLGQGIPFKDFLKALGM